MAIATVSIVNASCAAQPNCTACLDNPFCGWCSPSPTVYDNGTKGSQCQDQHDFGWHCNHIFSTSTCLVGYVCKDGGCIPDPAGGTGDTKENCEKHCKPPPSGLSQCNAKKGTCEPCKDYCSTNDQCPGSYCQGGLCHGSTCMTNTTCDSMCSNDTPEILLGTHRGFQIQMGFGAGEFDMKFQKKADGPQVSYRAPTGDVSTGSVTSDANLGGRDITLQFTTGPLTGVTLQGAYDAWEPSPETEQFAFYFGAPGDEKPLDIQTAMNGTGMTVYHMSKCSDKATSCSFDSVFPKLLAELVVDPCQAYANCSTCIGAASGLCGWCSNTVVYKDGTPGKQCAGFDSDGKPLGWQCYGVFSKTDCSDYGCDFTDIKNPKCKSGLGKLSKTDCSKDCKAPEPQYTCANGKTCEPCNMHYCMKDADCPGSYCNIDGAGPWSCHGEVPAGCMDKSSCASSCNATKETYAKCDMYSGSCTPVPAGTPGAQTKYECAHMCKATKPTGTYRAIAINADFIRGEYDFTFYDDNTMHWRDPDGKVVVAALSAGSESVEPDATAIDGTITKADDSKLVGKKIYAIFKRDEQGNDGIGKYIFNGFDYSPVSTFDDAMGKTEWVMLGCKPNDRCNFSKVAVPN